MSATAELSAALRNARAGRPVFPCWPNKQPVTPNGFKDATCDPSTIERWFANGSRYLLAIPTGAASGLVVLDVDIDNGWEWMRSKELPRTASVKTPRGGSHYYFKHPGIEVRCSVSQLAPNVDVRADGGYIIVPPSPGYETDEEAPVAEMPCWLRELVTMRSKGNGKRTPPEEWVRLVRDGVEEGQRNDSLARLAGHLLRKDVDIDLTTALAHTVNEHRFRPRLHREEVDRVVSSIAAAEQRRRNKPA